MTIQRFGKEIMASEQHDERKSSTQLGSSFESKSRAERLFNQVKGTFEACGAHLTAAAVLMIVSDISEYSDEVIAHGLRRCRFEIKPEKGFVNFNAAILLEKMGVVAGSDRQRAEAEQSWQEITKGFWTCTGDCGCGYQHFDGRKPRFDLIPKGEAVFRMVGGVNRITHTLISDIHFVRKDFMEAYETHEDIENLNGLPPAGSAVRGMLAGNRMP